MVCWKTYSGYRSHLLLRIATNQQTFHKLRADKIVSQIIMHESEPNGIVAAAAQAIASMSREFRM